MAHTKDRAVTLLHAHFNIPTITKATITGVAENDGNQNALEIARELLKCFPVAEVQHAATKLKLEDSEADNFKLTADNSDLQRRVADLEKDNADLKKNVSALAADVENIDPNLAGCIASAAALDEEASKVKVKREPGEGGQQGGVATETRASKRAKK